MKNSKFISIFVLLLILITLLIVALWTVRLPEDVKDTIGISRWTRGAKRNSPQSPEWMERMIDTNSNKSRQRSAENVLLNALGMLEISGPENVMTYIHLDAPCKKLKPYINVFERYRKDVPDKQLYIRLFNAIKKFHSIFCGRDERYRKLFAQWQDELLRLHEQFVDCQGAPDWYENPTTLCADASNVVNCNVETLRMEIGSDAANAFECIFVPIVNEAMIQPCNLAASKRDFCFEDCVSAGARSLRFEAFLILFTLISTLFF